MTKARRKILIIDDSALVLDLVKAALEAEGFQVLQAEDLADLERQMAASRPDLFLIDVQMPEAFGDDVGMLLRAARGVNVPILLFSSLDERELAQRAAEAGIDGYITKGSGINVLVKRIHEVLNGKGSRS